MLSFFQDTKLNCQVNGQNIKIIIPKSKRLSKVIKERELTEIELNKTKKLFELLGNPSTVFDIGGNLGYRAIHYILACKLDSLHTFEPSSYNFKYLSKNIAPFNTITSHHIGLSDSNGEAQISMPDVSQNSRVKQMKENTGMLSLYGTSDDKKETIQLKSLDNWACDNKSFYDNIFIKIDVEGHELNVLKGAQKFLAGDNHFWLEFNPATFIMANSTPEELINYMAKYSYTPCLFENNSIIPYIFDKENFDKVIDVLFTKK